MDVLITGGTGFLGSYLCEYFLQQKAKVGVLVRPRPSTLSKLSMFRLHDIAERVEMVPCDLGSFDQVRDLLQGHRPGVVVHLAAIVDVNLSRERPVEAFTTSAVGLLNLVEAVRQLELDTRIVNHTTDKVYFGNAIPFTEDMPFCTGTIYEIAKQSQDRIGTYYGKYYGLRIVTVRCGNFFGAFDFDFNRIIPYANRQIFLGEPIVLRSDGKMTRDFLYIKDAVRLHDLLLGALDRGEHFGVAFNFSHEVNRNVLSIVEDIAAYDGRRVEVVIEQTVRQEVPDMQLSCDRARHDLGWKAHYTFAEALRETCAEYRANFERYGREILGP